LFYVEFDNSQASYFTQNQRTLLIGQKLAAGLGEVDTPILVSSTDQAKRLFGVGSMLARMHAAYRAQDPFGEVWCIAVDDDVAGSAASGTITVTGEATEAGTLALYIAGQRINVGISANDTAAAVSSAIIAAVNAAIDLPVTAADKDGDVCLICRWKGATGNDVSMQDSFRGWAGNESVPAGIAIAYSNDNFLSGGTADPTLSTSAIAAMGDEEYDFVIHPYATAGALDDLGAELNDVTGRWAWTRQIFGHCYTVRRGTLGDLVAFGATRNDPHHTIAAIDVDAPCPAWEYAAAYGGANAVDIKADPARPTQTTPLAGLLAPRPGKNFILTERQSLLNYGIATSYVSAGVLRIERAITTYQKNDWGQTDPSYLDSETLHTLSTIVRRLRNMVTQKYGRHKLANDGTRFGPGQAIVTPKVIRGELLAEYAEMETLGLVENAGLFAQYLIVERNTDDPNRLDVLFPPDLVNQLRVFALLNQFRLQYK
jgi:phage tail sheath gpL-like